MNASYWGGRRVFITGHTGFKGSWLVLWLRHLGAEVTGFALPPTTDPNLFTAAEVGQGINSIIGDVRDPDAFSSAISKANPEVIFHMAAQSLVRASYENPIETYSTNVMGTVHLMEAVRHAPSVRAIVNITSDKCYEPNSLAKAHVEGDPMGGHDPYSSSKGCAELVTNAFRRSFFNSSSMARIASVRAGNVIGGGDWAQDRLMTDIMNAYGSDRAVNIRNPRAIRPWQFVLEPLAGYIMLAEALAGSEGGKFAEGWNFGPESDDMVCVAEVVEMLSQASDGKLNFNIDQGPHPHENPLLLLDSTKSRTRLGWRPKMRLADALSWTVMWHKGFINNPDKIRMLSLDQIKSYINL